MAQTARKRVTLEPGAAWVLIQLVPTDDPDAQRLTTRCGGALDATGVARIVAQAIPQIVDAAITQAIAAGHATTNA